MAINHPLEHAKTKPIIWFIVRNSWLRAKKKIGYLKKQTQFPERQNDVKSGQTRAYEDFNGWR